MSGVWKTRGIPTLGLSRGGVQRGIVRHLYRRGSEMKPGTLLVSEIFPTLQGEGIHTGAPTIFIRLYGCPLRCSWCDSMYAVNGGFKDFTGPRPWVYTIEEVLTRVRMETDRSGADRICLTGGEPLAQAAAPRLVRRLLLDKFHVDIETSGAVDIEPTCRMAELAGKRLELCMVMDIKLESSGAYRKQDFWTITRNCGFLCPHDQIKFVVSSIEDMAEVREWLEILREKWNGTHPHFLVSPVDADPKLGGLLASRILEWKLPIRLSMQVHKMVGVP